jgi:Fe-S-cluster containining protein
VTGQSPNPTIRVRLGPSDADISEFATQDVYFAFASGRLGYDCVTCGAKCCRGFGFLTGGAGQGLVASRRLLPLFVAPAGTSTSAGSMVHNFAPGCFFLQDDARCRIHVEDGYSAKPETCRLFPFNFIRRCGRRLIVAPHPSLCPLAVETSSRQNAHSDHQALLRDMESQGIMSGIGRAVCIAERPERAFSLEEAVVAASEHHLNDANYLAFIGKQIRLHEETGEPEIATECVAYCMDLAESLFEMPRSLVEGSDPLLTRAMVGATPYLRTQFVFPDADDRAQLTNLTLAHVPVAMFWVFIYATAARHAGMQTITFQTLSKITQDFAPVIRMMAIATEEVRWRSGVSLDLARVRDRTARDRLIRMSRALLPAVQASARLSLGEILRQNAPPEPYERAVFLRDTARHTAGKLAFAGSHRPYPVTTLRKRIGGSVERWLLQLTDDQQAGEFYDLLAMRHGRRTSQVAGR